MFGRSKKAESIAENISAVSGNRGRSLARDALDRFIRNRAALFCVFFLAAMILFVLIGPAFAKWNNEEIDWDALGDIAVQGAPSIDSGHYFGTDELGRDLYSRTCLLYTSPSPRDS